jgi:signal transduction histidine kinase
MANCFDATGTLDSAQYYHKKSLSLKLQTDNIVGAADSYNNLGIVYDLKGDYSQSLENYFSALEIYENNEVGFEKVPMVLVNIGVVYKKQKEFGKTLDYYKKALKIYEANKFEFGAVVIKGNIGSVFLELENYRKAINYAEEAKALYEKLGYHRYVPYMINNIAIAKDSLNLNDEALRHYRKAIELFEKDENLYELAYAKIGLGRMYAITNQKTQGRMQLQQALEISHENGFKEIVYKAYQQLSLLEASVGNYQKAFQYLQKYGLGKDSLFDEKKTQTIFELETRYETEKKEKEIAQQKEQLLANELEIKNKNLFAVLLGAGFIIAALALFGLFRRQQHKRKEHENELILKEIQVQNKLQNQRLRISRDLHDNIGSQLTFIISSIDNLKFLTKKSNENLRSKLTEINNFAGSTIWQLRDTIWAMNSNQISLENMYNRILSLIEKAKLATNNIQFLLNSEIKEEIWFSSIEGINIFRIVQEAVNNSIKHANPKKIEINMTQESDQIKIVIVDDGTGFDLQAIEAVNGLENMRNRMLEINGEISIESNVSKGTTIRLNLPKNRTNAV